MKFKYKKMIVLISMCVMLIGLIIFSMVNPSGSKKQKKKPVQKTEDLSVEPESTSTPVPTPTPTPVNTLTLDLEPEVTKVVKEYIEDSVKGDMDALEEVVSNISMMDEKELKIKYSSIEDVQNIECYMIPGPEEGGYLVYAYREFKVKDIETLAPGLSRVYVTIGADGKYRVFFGADTGLEDYVKKVDESKEVKELVERVNTKMQEAISKDAALKKFISGLSSDEDVSGNEKGEDSGESGSKNSASKSKPKETGSGDRADTKKDTSATGKPDSASGSGETATTKGAVSKSEN